MLETAARKTEFRRYGMEICEVEIADPVASEFFKMESRASLKILIPLACSKISLPFSWTILYKNMILVRYFLKKEVFTSIQETFDQLEN